MIETLDNLSKEELIAEVVNQKSENKELQIKLDYLKHQVEQYEKIVHGAKSEKFVPAENPKQTVLDLDLPCDVESENKTQSVSYVRRASKKKNANHTGRMELSKNLPREEIVIEPTEDVTGCVKIG